jgi:hypothetical protein
MVARLTAAQNALAQFHSIEIGAIRLARKLAI